MAGSREVRCVGPSYPLADRKSSVQRTVNMYLAPIEAQGEDKTFVLKSCPGATSTGPLLTQPFRGGVTSPDGQLIYYVSGSAVRVFNSATGTIDADFAPTLLTSSGDCRLAIGNDVVAVVDGANGYVGNTSTYVLTQITDSDWLGSSQVEFLDGYFIFVRPNSDQFYISAIDDPSNLDALDFSSADRLPGKIVAARVSKQELYLFCQQHTEIWVNSGGADFPFTRYQSAPIDVGLVGPSAVAKTSDSLALIGRTERGQAMVFLMRGHTPQRISNRAVEEDLLAAGVTLEQARVWAYQPAGHEFIGFEAPGMRSTWVYDLVTGQWHERARVSSIDGEFTRTEVADVLSGSGNHYAAFPSNDGTGQWLLGQLSESHYRWVSETMPRERTWPHLISPTAEPVRYSSLELMCSTGDGGNVSLECSNDGGHTWGSVLWRSLGTTGQFMRRVRWLMLGQARDRVFRLRCADNVPFTIHSAQLEAEA